jgi:hypothetical protein
MPAFASGFTGDQLRGLLHMDIVTGALACTRAAVHLLTFTELIDRPGAGELFEVHEFEWDQGDIVQMGQVYDSAALMDFAATAELSDSDLRMLALAVSLASGQPVDLAVNVAAGSPAHARRVIEAIAIATGYGDTWALAEKPAGGPDRQAHA